jgi:hypothetical protein
LFPAMSAPARAAQFSKQLQIPCNLWAFDTSKQVKLSATLVGIVALLQGCR